MIHSCVTSSDTNCTVFYTSQHTMSTDSKLDLILKQLQQQQQQLMALGPIQASLEDMKTSIREVKDEVKAVQHEVDCHSDRLLKLELEMQEQKDASNQQQQQLRSLTLRLLNLPVLPGEKDDNNAGLRARVYDTILKPLLSAAKVAKDLPTVPQAATVIESCFRPFNASMTNTDLPPHVIIKLSSRPIKIAILKHRKNIPKPAEGNRVILVEDLTPATHKMLSAISKSKAASKIWTIDGVIKFTMEGVEGVRTVKSVYDPLAKVLMR